MGPEMATRGTAAPCPLTFGAALNRRSTIERKRRSVSCTQRRNEYLSVARTRDAAPMRRRSAGSAASRLNASARPGTSSGSTRQPFTSGSTSPRKPGISVATIGRPLAIASMTLRAAPLCAVRRRRRTSAALSTSVVAQQTCAPTGPPILNVGAHGGLRVLGSPAKPCPTSAVARTDGLRRASRRPSPGTCDSCCA